MEKKLRELNAQLIREELSGGRLGQGPEALDEWSREQISE